MGNDAAAMLINTVSPQDGPSHQVDLQHVTTKGSAAKPQSQQSDLEMVVAYLKKADEIKAAKLAALKESAAKDPIVCCTDGLSAMPAGNTAATEETGHGGGM